MIVEVRQDGTIFASAKRGADFNTDGASGWEWFELLEATDGTVSIKWRGVGPPVGEVYGGDGQAGCNACHSMYVPNDYVASPKLQLANF
jgi:hypothetical protein